MGGGWRGIGVRKEPKNASDQYAVAAKKEGTIIGHLPRKVLRMCWLFLRRGGTIECTVTGHRKHSGGLA